MECCTTENQQKDTHHHICAKDNVVAMYTDVRKGVQGNHELRDRHDSDGRYHYVRSCPEDEAVERRRFCRSEQGRVTRVCRERVAA